MNSPIAVVDLDNAHIFWCETEEAAKDFESALTLLGHKQVTYRKL